ncbi:MAG TPA: aminoglycoside phosphotransferase family protein [Pyrinomonadaceae bacterium]|nr:aminoglycoside phosphotransferase family protein [Pyrinomonadaceae bacterium]
MLQPADEELITRDRVLGSTLRLLLDEETFRATLQARLPSVTITSARIVDVRYKPQANCLISYRIGIEGNELDVYAKGHESYDVVNAFSASEDAGFALGGGAFSLRDTTVVVFFFPYDLELRALKRLHPYESKFRAKFLRRLLPHHTHLCKGQLQRLRYKPERRFVARLSDSSEAPAALIKIYNGREFHAASRATIFHSDGPLRIAGLLGRSHTQHVLAFEWVSGRSLDNLLDHPTTTFNLELTGEALARLHAQSPAGLRQQRRLDGALEEIANGLGALIPYQLGNARLLTREISRRLAEATAQKCSIHGDFHANHLLVTDEGVAFLDLDKAAFGDPISDLGNFLAHLERKVLFGEMNPSQLEAARTALLAGYERQSKLPFSRDLLNTHTAAALMRLTHDPFRYRQPAWATLTSSLLDRVRKLLDCGSNLQEENSATYLSGLSLHCYGQSGS